MVYLRTVEGKQYKAALVRLMDDAFWEGRAKRDGLHITHRNGVKLDCELRNLVAVKPGQAGRKYHGRPHKRPVIRLDLHGSDISKRHRCGQEEQLVYLCYGQEAIPWCARPQRISVRAFESA